MMPMFRDRQMQRDESKQSRKTVDKNLTNLHEFKNRDQFVIIREIRVNSFPSASSKPQKGDARTDGLRTCLSLQCNRLNCSQAARIFPTAPERARPRAQHRRKFGRLPINATGSEVRELLRPRTGALRPGCGFAALCFSRLCCLKGAPCLVAAPLLRVHPRLKEFVIIREIRVNSFPSVHEIRVNPLPSLSPSVSIHVHPWLNLWHPLELLAIQPDLC